MINHWTNKRQEKILKRCIQLTLEKNQEMQDELRKLLEPIKFPKVNHVQDVPASWAEYDTMQGDPVIQRAIDNAIAIMKERKGYVNSGMFMTRAECRNIHGYVNQDEWNV